jgi:hypothetical protein
MTDFNSPNVDSLKKSKDDLKDKINSLQGIGLPPTKDVAKTLWTNLIQPKLLTERQISKKMLMMAGKSNIPPMSEEDAQLIVYGKIYYKNGQLYDNDKIDPDCVAKPGDIDYQQPIDENHPMWKKITEIINKFKDDLIQFGIKLGEFLFLLPQAIINITLSLTALASAAVILPFGSGLPTALSSVQTMIQTLKYLQSKTAEILPLLAIIDVISLILPKEAQAAVAQLNIIVGLFFVIVTTLTTILGLLDNVMSVLAKSKNKSDNQPIVIDAKAQPTSIKIGESTKLTASVTGGDWTYTYQWTDNNGNVIGTDNEITITPTLAAFINPKLSSPSITYTCTVKDGKGNVKIANVKVTRS